MAVLEAFVYDPLINWRLMQADVDTRRQEGIVNWSAITGLPYSCFIPDVDTDPSRAAELAKVAAYPQAPTRKLRADENDIFNGASCVHIFRDPCRLVQMPSGNLGQGKK